MKQRNRTLHVSLWIIAAALFGVVSPCPAQFKDAPGGGFPPPSGEIAFIRDQGLWLMNSDGSNPRELVTTGRIANKVDWSPDNSEILFCQAGMQAYQLPEGGGGTVKLYDIFSVRVADPVQITQISRDAISSTPEYFPDGKSIVFTRNLHALDVHQEIPNFQVFVQSLAGPDLPAKPLNRGKITTGLQLLTPAVSPDGQSIACVVTTEALVTSVKQSLGIAIVPVAGLAGTPGEWIRKAEQIPAGYAPAWSPDGRYLAFVDMDPGVRSLAIWDTKDKTKRIIYKPAVGAGLSTSSPAWSADGNWLVFSDAKRNITLVDRNGKFARQLTTSGNDLNPAFSN